MNDEASKRTASDAAAKAPTEVSTPPSNGPAQALPPSSHTWLVRSMLGLAAVLTVVGIFAVWANRQLLDTSYWTETNTKLLENGAIQNELSSYLTDQLYANVNVAGEIRAGLPSELKPLAGPAAGGLRSVVEKGIVLALQQPRVQQLWKTANQVTHKQFVNLIENKGRAIRTPGGGAVYPRSQSDRLRTRTRPRRPRVHRRKNPGQRRADQNRQLQVAGNRANGRARAQEPGDHHPPARAAAVRRCDRTGAGRRSRTLLNVGIVCVGAGLVTLVARSILGSQVVDTLASTEAVRPAASAAWSIGTSVLVDIAGAMIFIGVLVVLAGLLGGRSRWATATRRSLAPYLRDRPDITFGVAVERS